MSVCLSVFSSVCFQLFCIYSVLIWATSLDEHLLCFAFIVARHCALSLYYFVDIHFYVVVAQLAK